MCSCSKYLNQVYECLSVDSFDPCKFKSAGIKFLTLCLALEQIVGQASCTGQPKPMVDLQG